MSDTTEPGEATASPLEAYRSALARVTPRVGASFASAFMRDPGDPRLLRLACAHNWPQSAARWLGDMRIMEGRGPTGRAVGKNRIVEVPDLFAEPSLSEWWEPARELGFASMIALPLERGGSVFGALSFYFAEGHTFDDTERGLLVRAARDLAETAGPIARSGLSGGRSGPATGSR